jgi:phenylalanyl-tRNA synthetase alpha chain
MHPAIQSLQDSIQHLHLSLQEELKANLDFRTVEDIKIRLLGKKGPVQELMKTLKDIPAEEKKFAGKLINDFKESVEKQLSELLDVHQKIEEDKRINAEAIDITLPGKKHFLGRRHPVLAMQDKVIDVMIELGFAVQYGPDIETDYYNFESLNYSPDHPARDMQDTFYITPEFLLRTHNTSIQVRAMESFKPPIRIVCPGNVYRNEEITARSHVFFHQLDALYIDKGVSFADLLSTMELFFNKLFGSEIKTRVRPSYFPFVEPGMEVDILCLLCKGNGCNICKHSGWLEVAGAGLVHPEVLKNGGIDPEEYSGYAWGMGIERLVLIEKCIPDIRLFTENDMRFLEQFP